MHPSLEAAAEENLPPGELRVGVTGHRPDRLAGADLPQLQARVAGVVAALREAGRGRVAVVSALAEGADQLVAAEALAAGLRLVCPLPFPRAAYERDFSGGDARAIFRSLLAQADEVEELPGERSSPGRKTAAYAAVGARILDRADVLIAIWDGATARGPGGTADIVALARRAGIPVVWIAATPPHRVAILDDGLPWTGIAQTALEAIRPLVTRTTTVDADHAPGEIAGRDPSTSGR